MEDSDLLAEAGLDLLAVLAVDEHVVERDRVGLGQFGAGALGDDLGGRRLDGERLGSKSQRRCLGRAAHGDGVKRIRCGLVLGRAARGQEYQGYDSGGHDS